MPLDDPDASLGAALGPGFHHTPPRDGYAWWYLDALSEDHRHGLTIIVFLGSVFSPYYAIARRQGPADPMNHCCINVALYGSPARFAMTDRPVRALKRDDVSITVGPSAMRWDGKVLTLDLDEVAVPLPRRIRGQVRLTPGPMNRRVFTLDAAGHHHWRPMSAAAKVEVELEHPGLSWKGHGYFDSNWGSAPLERDFQEWDWCRVPLKEGAAILYDARRRDGTRQQLALRFHEDGRIEEMPVPPDVTMRRSMWGIRRATQSEKGARIVKTLLDTPFYARSVLETTLCGETAMGVHESLDCDRFAALPIQLLLPFRVPRRWV